MALFLLLLSYEVSCKPREDITKAVDSSAFAQRSSALSPNSSRIRPWSLFKRHSFSKCEKPRFMVNGKLVLECKRGSLSPNTSRIPLRPAMDSFQERKLKNFQVESDPFFGHL